MSYSIEYRGDASDAYIVGNLAEARSDADRAEGAPLDVRVTVRDGWYSAEGADGNYWGSGSTEEAALRYLIGAVLDPREGR